MALGYEGVSQRVKLLAAGCRAVRVAYGGEIFLKGLCMACYYMSQGKLIWQLYGVNKGPFLGGHALIAWYTQAVIWSNMGTMWILWWSSGPSVLTLGVYGRLLCRVLVISKIYVGIINNIFSGIFCDLFWAGWSCCCFVACSASC